MSKEKIRSLQKKLETLCSESEKGASGKKKVDVLNSLANEFLTLDSTKTEWYASKALALAVELKYTRGSARSHNNIGNFYDVRGDSEKALDEYSKALAEFEDIQDQRGIAGTYNNIGLVHQHLGEYDKSLAYFFDALRIYKKIGTQKQIAKLLGNIGLIHKELEEYARAFEFYNEALRISKMRGDQFDIAVFTSQIGGIHLERKDNDQALDYYRKALSTFEKLDEKYGIAIATINIGLAYTNLGDYEKALDFYHTGLKLFEELGDARALAHSVLFIGGIYARLKRYDVALTHMQKGVRLAEDIEAKDLVMLGYKDISELHEEQLQFEEALNYHKKYTECERKIFNAERTKQIANMRIRYDTDKKEKENEIHQLKNVKLRKEVKERKKAEKELKQHQDHLEDLVAERTAELEKENAERRRAEQELLRHQEQLRSLTREISLVEEKQRRKFATFLHDDISQTLGLAVFKLRSLDEMGSVTDVRKEAKKVKKIIDQAIERARALAFEISPPVLYELGLEPALEWLVRQFGRQYRLSAQFKDDGITKPITDDARVFLFQSVRELLSNVTKHSRAKSVTVSASKDNNSICITVADDGIGFDAGTLEAKIAKNEGFGLFNVRERLRHINGQIEIRSKKGEGTSVILNVPLIIKQKKKKRR